MSDGDGAYYVEALRKYGLKEHAISGVLGGNIWSESAGNTKAVGDSGTAFGMAQWRLDRREKLNMMARMLNKPAHDREVQVKYLMYELDNDFPGLKNELNNTKSPEQAALIFAQKYERPKEITSVRPQNARIFHGILGKLPKPEQKESVNEPVSTPATSRTLETGADPTRTQSPQIPGQTNWGARIAPVFGLERTAGLTAPFPEAPWLKQSKDPNQIDIGLATYKAARDAVVSIGSFPGDVAEYLRQKNILKDDGTWADDLKAYLQKAYPVADVGEANRAAADILRFAAGGTFIKFGGAIGKLAGGLLGEILVTDPRQDTTLVLPKGETALGKRARIGAEGAIVPIAAAGIARVANTGGKEGIKAAAREADAVIRDAMSLRQASMLSQPMTTARNIATAEARIVFETSAELLDSAIGAVRNQVRKTMGLAPLPVKPFDEAFSLISGQFNLPKTFRYTDAVLDNVQGLAPNLAKARLLGTRLMDSARNVGIQQVNEALTTLNTSQENVLRRVNFIHYANEGMRKEGFKETVQEAIQKGMQIPYTVADYGIENALRMTWAQDPQSALGKELLKAFHKIPGDLGTVLVPFPRYTFNAWKALNETMPWNVFELMSGRGRDAIRRGDHKALGRFITSVSGLTALNEVYGELEGSKIGTIKIPGRTSELNVMPYMPFAAPWIALGVTHRAAEGRLNLDEAKETVLQALASPIGIQEFDLLDSSVRWLLDSEAAKSGMRLADWGAKVGASFLTALKPIKDLLNAAGMPDMGIARDTKGANAINSIVDPLNTPEAPSTLRANPPTTTPEESLLKQGTGALISHPSALETEVGKLGLTFKEVTPKGTGTRELDLAFRDRVGQYAEPILTSMINTPEYQNLSIVEKKIQFKQAFNSIIKEVRKEVYADFINRVPGGESKVALAEWYKLSRNNRALAREVYPDLKEESVLKQMGLEDIKRIKLVHDLSQAGMSLDDIRDLSDTDFAKLEAFKNMKIRGLDEKAKMKAYVNKMQKGKK